MPKGTRKQIDMSKSAKKYRIVSDREGGLPVPEELACSMNINIGDEFAAWRTSKGIVVVFKKNGRWKRRIPKHAQRGRVEPVLPKITVTLPKPTKPIFQPIPETLTDGWLFGSYTRYADPKGCRDGDGFVIAPDGQRAELDWHIGADKLKRTGRADKRIWGVFEIGFPHPVTSKADLVENFRAVLPQIKTAFARHQKRNQ